MIAGDGIAHRYRYADVAAYHRRVVGRLQEFLASRPATVAEPVAHCDQCRWLPTCAAGWRSRDHLSLVAFMRTDHRLALEAAGIRTVAELAGRRAAELPPSIGRASRERLVAQAALQLGERRSGVPAYELLPPTPGTGLLRLPTPDPADLYLDFEGDPYVEPAGREYLAGIGDRAGGFVPIWAHDLDAERRLTEQLVDRLLAAWQANPGLHVYHYAPYERSALQRLTSRHGVREAELDILLRAEVLVDLYAVVRQGVRISKESYSIKKLEAFYWGHTRSEGDVADALSSVVAYETLAGRTRPGHPRPDPGLQRRRRALDPRPARVAGAAARRAGGHRFRRACPAGAGRNRTGGTQRRRAGRGRAGAVAAGGR